MQKIKSLEFCTISCKFVLSWHNLVRILIHVPVMIIVECTTLMASILDVHLGNSPETSCPNTVYFHHVTLGHHDLLIPISRSWHFPYEKEKSILLTDDIVN